MSHDPLVGSGPSKLVCNRQPKSKIASKYTKTARQILADIPEQTVTPTLITYYESVITDICGSLLLFIQCTR